MAVSGLLAFALHRGTAPAADPGAPIVLQQVQALGDLHSVRYTYQDVLQHSTERAAQPWVRWVPGGPELVAAATRNTATLAVTGAVEAGVDLRHAELRNEGAGRWTLQVPRAQIYEPQVQARVVGARHGMFWRDDNLSLSAVEAAKSRFEAAAEQQHIRAEAERNAIERIKSIIPPAANQRLDVVVNESS